MNRDDIMKMQAGREVDALIATEIFGWKLKKHRWDPDQRFLGDFPEDKEITGRTYRLVPDYSTDISAAWQIIEKFENRCMMNHVHTMWECYLPNGEGVSKSPSLAICRAALLATIK